MNSSIRKNKREWGQTQLACLFLLLMLCVAVSAVLLTGRLRVWASRDDYVIELAPSEENLERNGMSGSRASMEGEEAGQTDALPSGTTEGGLREVKGMDSSTNASSENISETEPGESGDIWETESSLELFSISYENGEGTVTAKSGAGDHVLAPGTENSYTFRMKNTWNTALDYTMEIEAYVTPQNVRLPIQVRMKDYEGSWMLGGEEDWEDILALDGVKDEARLGVSRYAQYTLNWQWPFESGDDVYDTWLGDQSTDQDITLTVVIRTTVSADTDSVPGKDPSPGGGTSEGIGSLIGALVSPRTGDHSHIVLYAVLAAASAAVLIFLLILIFRRRKEEERDEGGKETGQK